VLFDTVDFTDEDDATTEVLWADGTAAASQDSKLRVAYITKNTADAGSAATKAKRSFEIDPDGSSAVSIWANGVELLTPTVLSDNTAQAVQQILSTTALSNADGAEVTLTATAHAKPSLKIRFDDNSSSMENSMTTVSTNFSFTASDLLTLTLSDGFSVATSAAATSSESLANNVYDAWVTKYGSSDATTRWRISSVSGSEETLIFTATDSGTSQIGVSLKAALTIASNTLTNVGYIIGNGLTTTKDLGDNTAKGESVIITLEADTAGSDLSQIGEYGDTQADTALGAKVSSTLTVDELTSTLDAQNTTDSGANTASDLHVYESRSDVVLPQETEAAASSNANTFSRIGWL